MAPTRPTRGSSGGSGLASPTPAFESPTKARKRTKATGNDSKTTSGRDLVAPRTPNSRIIQRSGLSAQSPWWHALSPLDAATKMSPRTPRVMSRFPVSPMTGQSPLPGKGAGSLAVRLETHIPTSPQHSLLTGTGAEGGKLMRQPLTMHPTALPTLSWSTPASSSLTSQAPLQGSSFASLDATASMPAPASTESYFPPASSQQGQGKAAAAGAFIMPQGQQVDEQVLAAATELHHRASPRKRRSVARRGASGGSDGQQQQQQQQQQQGGSVTGANHAKHSFTIRGAALSMVSSPPAAGATGGTASGQAGDDRSPLSVRVRPSWVQKLDFSQESIAGMRTSKPDPRISLTIVQAEESTVNSLLDLPRTPVKSGSLSNSSTRPARPASRASHRLGSLSPPISAEGDDVQHGMGTLGTGLPLSPSPNRPRRSRRQRSRIASPLSSMTPISPLSPLPYTHTRRSNLAHHQHSRHHRDVHSPPVPIHLPIQGSDSISPFHSTPPASTRPIRSPPSASSDSTPKPPSRGRAGGGPVRIGHLSGGLVLQEELGTGKGGPATPSSHNAGGGRAAPDSRGSSSKQSGSSRRKKASSTSSTDGKKKHKKCNCKKSKCLKLYCECFARGAYCDGCNCSCCSNQPGPEHKAARDKAIQATLERDSNAFFRGQMNGFVTSGKSNKKRHRKGCACKKSGCQKKYCECFQAGVPCTELCKCLDCKNGHPHSHHDHSKKKGAQRVSSSSTKRRPSSTHRVRRTNLTYGIDGKRQKMGNLTAAVDSLIPVS